MRNRLYRLGVALACFLVLPSGAPPARAAAPPDAGPKLRIVIDQLLPGLGADAQHLRFDLTGRLPWLSAATQAERAAADAALKAAEASGDWGRVAGAARQRLGLGQATDPATWLALAEAELRLPHGSSQDALEAAYIGFTERAGAAGEAPTARRALMLMASALAARNDHLAELSLLGAVSAAYPDDQATRARLVEEAGRWGFAVRAISTEPQSFPARACIAFTLRLPATLHPGDYVSTEPTLPHLAATEEDGRLCLAGLPPGASTVVHVRPGLPSAVGVPLDHALSIRVTLANRKPALIADPTHYIIPASNQPAIGFAAVNVSKLRIRIARVAERSLLGFLADHPLLNPGADDSSLSGDNAPIIFTGTASVPGFARNRLVHAVLPLAAVMTKPGLYAVSLAPDDGTPDEDGSLKLVQLVLRTDIAPTTWRGRDGLTAQLRRYTDATPIAGARVALIAGDNAVLATATTDAAGMAHFAAPLLAGPGGQAPAALHITGPDKAGAGRDFTLVDLGAAPFDLTDRGVSGRAQPPPIDPFLWLDRGIYRPGETVHLGALLRDPAGEALNVPLHLIVRRPGGQVFADQVVRWTDDSSLVEPIRLSPGAQAGRWSVALAVSDKAPALATRHFTVAAFVPARLAIDFARRGDLLPARIETQPIGVRFLYGAPGAALTGSAEIRILADPSPFPAFRDYTFGLHGEIVDTPLLRPSLPETDAKGASAVAIDLTHLPDTTQALQAQITVTIDDPSGRSVSRATTLRITPRAPLLGIRQDFSGEAVDRGAAAGFDLLAVGPDGKPVTMPVDLSLVRQDSEWSVIWDASVARWRFTYIDRPVLTRGITIDAARPYHLELPPLPYGRYRLRIVQHDGGLAAASTVFYSGWVTSGDPGVPARLTVARDRRSYAAGDIAHLHVTAPFAGKATLVIANDRVLATRNIDLPATGADLDVPVAAAWGAGAYAIVELYQPASGKTQPDRAIGLTWLGLEPGARKLPVALDVEKLYRPARDADIAVRTTPGAWVTLAAVDEGILALTDFRSPDPLAHFFGKRRLAVDIADSYGALLRPGGGEASTLHQGGGGDFGPAQAPIPQQIVSLYAGPVQAGTDGVAHFRLHLPDFNGQIRLMATAWLERAVGAASADIVTRHELIADLLLPRFLAPGDAAQIGIMAQDLDLPAGRFTFRLTTAGAVSGGGDISLDLAQGARQVARATLTANAIGTGRIMLDAAGPGGYRQHRERDIDVHLVRAPRTVLTEAIIAPDARLTLVPDTAPFVPGSATATLTLGSRLPFDPAAFMQALHGIAYRFVEASVSRGLPLTALTGAAAGPDPQGRLAAEVENVLDDQRYDGAFGLWSSQEDAQPWLSAYATDFLLRARAAGAEVPAAPLDSALAWLRREVDRQPADRQADIYAAYVLARAGQAPAGAIRVMDDGIADVAHPLARAQLGAALALIGEPGAAHEAFARALELRHRGGYFWWRGQDWNDGYGTPLRDAWAVPTLIRESGLMGARWPQLAANLPGAGIDPDSLGTQELAMAGLAAATFAGPPQSLALTLDGVPTDAAQAVVRRLAGPLAVANRGTAPVPAVIAVSGIPAAAQQATTAGMELKAVFYTTGGQVLDVSRLTQNTVFVMVVSGRAIDSAPHHAILTAGLPAGWELAGNISSGAVHGMRWLGELTEPRARAAADDRYMAAFTLYPPCSNLPTCEDDGHDQEFRTAVELRAVTPGRFLLPGAALVDLDHPLIRGTAAEREVTVLPAGAPAGPAASPPGHAPPHP